MNEFTLIELQIISLDMHTYINRTPMLSEPPIHKELREKIDGMIDNYCEHDDSIEQDLLPQRNCEKCNMPVFGEFPCPCTLRIRGI